MERVVPARCSRSTLSIALASVVCLVVLSGCATPVPVPKPPAQQDPFAGLPITKPGDETPLDDVPMGKDRDSLKVGLLLSGNTKAAQQYADDYLAVLAGTRGNPQVSGNIAVTPVLEAIEEGFEQATHLDRWEDAKRTGVDLVALVDLSCSLPETDFHPASYSVSMYMLTPDGKLLAVIRAAHSESSLVPQQMLMAGMMGRNIDNARGGSVKATAAYERAFMDNARMQSGPGQIILRGAKAVSRLVERKIRDFLDEFEESRAFANRGKGRAQPR